MLHWRFMGLVTAPACVVAVMLLAASAHAHPFGEPQTVRLSAEGSVVRLTWRAPPDDIILLGGAVGALPDRREIVLDTSPGADPTPVGVSDAERIRSSPEVEEYLVDHLAIRQDGRSCSPEVSLAEITTDGAHVTFECARPVTDVDVEITMLTDLHEAYRTAAIGDGTTAPERALYTIDDTIHSWTFTSGSGAGGSTGAPTWLVAGGVVAGFLVLGAVAWRLTRQRQP